MQTQIGEHYIATSKVTALEHEVGDDSVEARISEGEFLAVSARVALAKLAEVLGGLGHDVIVEIELNPAGLVCRRCQLRFV
jgi:hypothetical protein